jgi:hypothetical protein
VRVLAASQIRMLQIRLELFDRPTQIAQSSISLLKGAAKCIVEQLALGVECLSRWRRYRDAGQIRERRPNLLKSLLIFGFNLG